MHCEHEFLAVLTEEPQTTKKIAKKVGCDYRTANKRLKYLLKEGRIAGSLRLIDEYRKSWIWWVWNPDSSLNQTIVGLK